MRCFRTIAIRFPSITERIFLYWLKDMRHTFNSGCYFWYLRTHAYDQFWVQSPNWFNFIKLRINFENVLFINLRLLIFSPQLKFNVNYEQKCTHRDHLDKRNGYRVRCMRSSEWILNRALCVIRPLCLKMEYFFGHFWAVNKTILCIKIGEYTGSGKWTHTPKKRRRIGSHQALALALDWSPCCSYFVFNL